MTDSDVENKYLQFEKLVQAQPKKWRSKLHSMYITDPEVAVAAWTLILSMDDLMLDIEETASFYERLQEKQNGSP